MPGLLYIMTGMPSCYHSGLEFCSRLMAAGYDVTVACNRDVAALANARGIDFSLLVAGDERRRDFVAELRAIDALHPMLRPLARLRSGWLHRRQSLDSSELDLLIERQCPDVLAIDIECHYAIVTTRRYGIPTLLCSRWFDHFRAPGYPPLHSMRMPSIDSTSRSGPIKESFLSRIQIAGEWWALRLKRITLDLRDRVSVNRLKPIDYRCTSPVALRALARWHGQRPSTLFATRDWLLPHGYRALPVLSFTAAELDFPHRVHSQLHYAGPMVSCEGNAFPEETMSRAERLATDSIRSHPGGQVSENKPSVETSGNTLDGWRAVQRRNGCKLVYCSMGTWLRSDGGLLGEVLSLASRRHDLAFVVGLGGLLPTSSPGTIPANVLVLDAAPQVELLANADAAILHAGIASMNESLQCQTPALVFSVGSNDQNGCAARFAWHRLGQVMDRQIADADAIGEALDVLLSDTALADRLATVAGLFDRYRDDKVVETLVARLTGVHPEEQSMPGADRH